MTFRGIHGSVRVGFVPNPEPTRSHWVGGWTTRRRSPTTLGRVRSGSGGQRSGRLKSEWVSTSRSSLNLHRKSPNLHRISPNLCWIFVGSVDFSLDLCDNHGIEARKTTSSPNLNENFHLIVGSSPDLLIFLQICVTTTGSKQKTPPQAQIWAKTSILSLDLTKNYQIFTGSEWI